MEEIWVHEDIYEVVFPDPEPPTISILYVWVF